MLSRIKLHFSWKQKLSVVIAVTLIGLIIVTGSGIFGFNSINKSVTKQNQASEFKQLSLTFSNKLLLIKLSASDMKKDDVESFLSHIAQLTESAKTMKEKASILGYEHLEKISSKLLTSSEQYADLSKQWIEELNNLGFSPKDGALLTLSNKVKDLVDVSFSVIKEPINNVSLVQKSYLISKSSEGEEKIFADLKSIKQSLKDFGWEDNKIGITVKEYESVFNDVHQRIVKERNILASMDPVFVDLHHHLDEKNTFLDEVVIKEVVADADSKRSAAINVMILVAAIVGIMTLISLGGIARQLNIQLKAMQKFLKTVAAGDFSQQLSVNKNEKDEFTQLRSASNYMTSDISSVIAKVANGNHTLMDLRAQMEKAVEKISQMSAQLEEKTAQSTVATEEISTAVDDVVKRSVDVNEEILSTSESTRTNTKVINDCVDSMENIGNLIESTHNEVNRLAKSSSKMMGIIDVINDLADQTNLLALNAAIESARAGEAGRGFSVVADEVRALAQKTVGATSSIGEIIKDFHDQSKNMGNLMDRGVVLVSSGKENANNVASSFDIIDGSIQKVTSDMEKVVHAVEKISTNTNDISSQIHQICDQSEDMNKTRISLEEHTHALSSQAETLENLTDRFKLP